MRANRLAAGAKSPTEHRKEALARHLRGEDLKSIAADFGCTHQAVSQALRRMSGGEVLDALKALRSEQRQDAKLWGELTARASRAIELEALCIVCGAWILRDPDCYVTCSPECAVAWPILRWIDQEAKFRVYRAKSILKRPEKYKDTEVAHAQRILEEGVAPNRRFHVPGSTRSQLIRRFRPDTWEVIK